MVIAFLYRRSSFHHSPPPQVLSQPPRLWAKTAWAALRYRRSPVRSYAATQASAHHPLSSKNVLMKPACSRWAAVNVVSMTSR